MLRVIAGYDAYAFHCLDYTYRTPKDATTIIAEYRSGSAFAGVYVNLQQVSRTSPQINVFSRGNYKGVMKHH
jgi:hypothetical protein